MKLSWFSFYNLALALWVGGMAIFTFVITPVIFKSYSRDMASEIVGKLFPLYFMYKLVLAALAMVLFFLVAEDHESAAYRLSLVLIAAAVIINVFIVYKLHPEAVRIKQQVASFERESPDSPARKKFTRLHALSASLNLLLLADGTALLLASPFLKK
jgi:uncharacterized membrane protein